MRMKLADRAKTFALELLGQFDSHISAKSLWHSISSEFSLTRTPNSKPFSALHCISHFGIAEAVFSAVRGPRRARRGDCQEPGTGRDGKT